MSPNRHVVNTSRHELARMVSAKALRRLAFLSLSNLALLISATDSEDKSPRALPMYSIPSFESTSLNARWRYPRWRKLIERSISACFDFAKDSSCDSRDRSRSARLASPTRRSAISVASRKGPRLAGIRADLFPYRSNLSEHRICPLESWSFP